LPAGLEGRDKYRHQMVPSYGSLARKFGKNNREHSNNRNL
jgi:hypothetical protein